MHTTADARKTAEKIARTAYAQRMHPTDFAQACLSAQWTGNDTEREGASCVNQTAAPSAHTWANGRDIARWYVEYTNSLA